ncbi:MAG: M42 family metallopeptidase [Candidatus Hadarchaeaceae archaeon]
MRDLMESFGPSGFEAEPAKIVKEYMKPYSSEIISDKLGSIIFVVKGKSPRPRILLAGHLDEVGFVVTGIDEKTGFLKFGPLGGWWDQVLLSQRVTVRTEKGDLPGVISSKPPHVLTEEEKKAVVKKEDMHIDIGACSFDEAVKMGVRIGDPVTPWSPFSLFKEGKFASGKGFDDRIGVFVIGETVRRIKEHRIKHPNTVYAAATVQEEVGLRGAKTSAHVVDPDVGIVLEVDIAGDVPGIQPHQAPTKLGKGPSLLTYDRSMIPNQPLKNFIIELAEKKKIPLQLSQSTGGGTDAGSIHLNRAGCPTAVISVPTRHIHTHVGYLCLEDVENAVKLTIEIIRELDIDRVRSFTEI